jgi:hypothetical protein
MTLCYDFCFKPGQYFTNQLILLIKIKLAEGVGFEPTVALRLRLISSQVPLTTQPPFRASRC